MLNDEPWVHHATNIPHLENGVLWVEKTYKQLLMEEIWLTTQHVWSLVNNGIFTISTGAGFLPSTEFQESNPFFCRKEKSGGIIPLSMSNVCWVQATQISRLVFFPAWNSMALMFFSWGGVGHDHRNCTRTSTISPRYDRYLGNWQVWKTWIMFHGKVSLPDELRHFDYFLVRKMCQGGGGWCFCRLSFFGFYFQVFNSSIDRGRPKTMDG